MKTGHKPRIIALAGLKFSGKTTLAAVAAKEFGYDVLRTRDQILADAADYGIVKPSKDVSIEEMQYIGNRGRSWGGNGYWAQRLFESAVRRGTERLFMMDGVRHPDEIAVLSKKAEESGAVFAAVAVEAWSFLRFGRVADRNDEGDAQLRQVAEDDKVKALQSRFEKFTTMDDRDRGIGEPWHGQQVDACMARARELADGTCVVTDETLADDVPQPRLRGYVLRNNDTLEAYQSAARTTLLQIHLASMLPFRAS